MQLKEGNFGGEAPFVGWLWLDCWVQKGGREAGGGGIDGVFSEFEGFARTVRITPSTSQRRYWPAVLATNMLGTQQL